MGDGDQGRWEGQDPQRWHPKATEQVRALTLQAQDARVVPKSTLRGAEEPFCCCRCRTGWQQGPRVGSGPLAEEVMPSQGGYSP